MPWTLQVPGRVCKEGRAPSRPPTIFLQPPRGPEPGCPLPQPQGPLLRVLPGKSGAAVGGSLFLSFRVLEAALASHSLD